MFFNNGRPVNQILPLAVAIFVVFTSPWVDAQQAKVVKVQGKKAIVQFPDDARPRVGQVIELGPVSMSGGGVSTSSGSREMIVGGSAELSSLTPSGGSSSTTKFAIDGRYGWNAGQMEYGGIASVDYQSSTGSSARLLSGGGFFDYNLVPNTPGTDLVYGGAVLGQFGSIGSTIGNAERTGTIMRFELGGQLKWYPLGNSVAVRGDLLYRIDSISDTLKNTGSNTGSGIVAKAGFYIYF